MKFGTTYAYWTKQPIENYSDYLYYAKKVEDIGFDILEISASDLLKMSDVELKDLKNLAIDLELELCSNIGPPKQCDIASADPAVRAAGIAFLSDIMKKMDMLDSRYLIGIIHNFWPNDFSDLDKPAVWARGVEGVKALGKIAENLGIFLCLEVVNRFDGFVLNTAEEGARFCDEVDNPYVKIQLDTFHMNIEEDDFSDAIRLAGNKLVYMHVSEGNRKLPGQGRLPWADIGTTLRDIGFNGRVVMEAIVQQGGQIGNDFKIFRDLSSSADNIGMDNAIKESLLFLRENFTRC